MATFTRTIKENYADPSAAKSTWTLTITSGSNITITNEHNNINIGGTVQAKYSAYGGKKYGSANITLELRGGSHIVPQDFGTQKVSWPAGTNKTLTNSNGSLSPYYFFDDSNATVKTININYYLVRYQMESTTASSSVYTSSDVSGYASGETNINLGTGFTVTLNVPPTIYGVVDGNTYDDMYIAGHSIISFEGDIIPACYGNVSKTRLTIGNQSKEVTSGSPSILLDTAGTFTPAIYTVDSRGLSKTQNFSTITVYPDNPPTCDYTQVQSSLGQKGFWTKTSNATVTLSNFQSAITNNTSYYIDSATLTIGSQSDTISLTSTSTEEILSIPLNTQGIFTPVLTLHDTRGITNTINLNQIEVQAYQPPDYRNVGVERTTQDGKRADDGTYCVITCTPVFVNAVYTRPPSIEIIDEEGTSSNPTSVVWYSNRDSVLGELDSNDIISTNNDWNNIVSNQPIYGLITKDSSENFSIYENYEIVITATDSYGEGATISPFLEPAYYTVDFLAGGKGVAFGRPAMYPGFHCGLDAHFYEKAVDDSGIVTVHLMPTNDFDWNSTRDSTNRPETSHYGVGYGIVDSQGVRTSNLDTHMYTDGNMATVLGAHRVINGEDVRNQLYLNIGDDGTISYGITDSDAFKNALGLLNPSISTPTFSGITSGATISGAAAAKYGKVCTLSFSASRNAAVSAGANVLQATIDANHRPRIYSTGVGYYGGSLLAMAIAANGSLVIRNIGATLAANSGFGIAITYVLA